jgi:two-component system response regulator AtoC
MGIELDDNAPVIMVVDDEPNLRRVLTAVLEREGYRVVVADSGRDAVRKAKAEARIDLLVTDYLMPDLNGLQVLEAVRKSHPGARAILVSGHGTVRSAVEAIKLGAFDYLTKPFDVDQVRETVGRALRSESHVPEQAEPQKQSAMASVSVGSVTADPGTEPTRIPKLPGCDLIGDSPASHAMVERLLRAGRSNRATVLLLGESGTGKEVAARLLHEASPRRRGPFVAVSCAALPDSLLESELFGHEKSAFTGAAGAKPGRFELAEGGTLFLDEIGDIPHLTQVKLLRALQEREVCRIGGVKPTKVDVRVVAATNRDLWRAVEDGSFRLDLYYRLNVVPVRLPSLQERASDIPSLAKFFLAKACKENGRRPIEGISSEALSWLTAHPWPGNIRELQNAMEYASVMAAPDATQISCDDLPETLTPLGLAPSTRLRVVNG